MPWVVGVDEAGYGPNLGPFVMSVAAVHVPAEHANANLWKLLKHVICRAGEADDGRIVVDDSKEVYVHSAGVSRLERNVLPFLPDFQPQPIALEASWNDWCATPIETLHAEPWFQNGLQLPLQTPPAEAQQARARLFEMCQELQVRFAPVRAIAVFSSQFNELTNRHNSKAAVPAWTLQQLLHHLPQDEDGLPMRVFIDKLGGRNFYHPLLQTIFPDRLVMCRVESGRESTYHVIHHTGNCDVSFQPEADGRYLPVALASMVSKYLREVLMEGFNRFWRNHVPDLRPTAGYPGDSARFYKDIRAARKRLGIEHKVLWRSR